MKKLDREVIEQIQNSNKTNSELAKELWLNRTTVRRHRKMQDRTNDEVKSVLSRNEERMWLKNKMETMRTDKSRKTKEEKENEKKLKLLENYNEKDIKEMLRYIATNKKREIDEVIWEPWHLKFWLVSDTHFGSKNCAKDELNEFYDRAKDKWVECFFHSWDIVDWTGVYQWQQFEQDAVWYDEQIKDIKENYPKTWLPTYFIGWNHCESFLKWWWADITKAIEVVRDDLVNLWFYDAKLKINWIVIQLHHWWWSISYAKDYKLNKLLDKIEPQDHPDIYSLWHYHTALYSLHRWIHAFMPWAFLKENLLSKRFNLWNIIWWWIVEIEKDKQWKSNVNMEFVRL